MSATIRKRKAKVNRNSGLGDSPMLRSRTVRLPLRIPAPGERAFDVAGCGLNSVDLLAVVAEYPRRNSKQRLQRFARMPGGQIATALVTCAKLGWTTRYVGSFGDDELGAMSRDSLTEEGVDISAARIVAGTTNQFAVILVDAGSGERTVLWDRHPALTMEPGDVPQEAVTSGRMLIVDCHETAAATQAARYARDAAIPTVLDVEKVRPGISDLLHQVDVIIAAQDFPTALTGHEDLGRALEVMAREYAAPVVCVTLGQDGKPGAVPEPGDSDAGLSRRLRGQHRGWRRLPGRFCRRVSAVARRRYRGRVELRRRGGRPELPRPGGARRDTAAR